ncbi:hypothetical protein PybrP1_005519 [[Pythium] brassicae (nom. inval.)]|nr:hypothetical protein PybrP1_005519 [[Pythium] brassicae (nom. inval.)]
MFSAAEASPRPSAGSVGSTAPPPPPPPPSVSNMTSEQLFAHQLDLHKKIQEQMQQQLQLQKEMSLQMGQKASTASGGANASATATATAATGPDLGDNVFDMLDDLIMIPSGAVAPERNSLSKQAALEMGGEDDDDGEHTSSGRDSLADILESLDMDLEDFEMQTSVGKSSFGSAASASDSGAAGDDAARSSFDDDFDDLDDLDLDLDSDMEDHGIDDDDDDDDDAAAAAAAEAAAAAAADAAQPAEEFLDMRRSSFDMMASISGSTSSISQSPHGNLCTLVWEGGLLGLRLRLSQSRMLPAVSKLTGRSAIFGIHLVDVGDLLVQIGTRMMRDMEFMDAINYLKEVEKPCKLVFRRPNADPMAVKTVQPLVKSSIALKLAQKFEELASAETDKTPQGPVVKLDAKYEVKWLDGPLGISLIASKDVPYPLVTRITGKNRSPQVQDVQPGHYLVQIGSYDTADGNFNSAIKFLQKVNKPVSLFFCPGNKQLSVRPDVAPDEYDHVWEKKQALSFTVKPDEFGRMVIADLGSAKSIKVKAKGGPNLAAFVSPGDRIEWINDDHTKDLTFHESLLKLRTAKRPLVIRFKKPSPPEPTPPALPVPTLGAAPLVPVASSEPSSLAAATTTPGGKAATTGRSFNPLKKIAALSSYAKENSQNNANARNSETRKGSQSAADAAPPRKASHTTADMEVKRVSHESNANQPKPSGYTTAASAAAAKAGASEAAAAANGDSEFRRDGATKLLNVDLLNSIRKTSMAKTSSDASASSNNERVAAHAPLKPLTLETRHLTPKHAAAEEPVAAPHKQENHYPQQHQQNPQQQQQQNPQHHQLHLAQLATTYTGEEGEVYEVVWPEGTALGLTLRVHPTTRFPVVARVTGTSNLKNIEHVSPGDVLFAANGMAIVPQPKFKQTLDNLSKLPKPAHLRFRRAQAVFIPPASRAEEQPMDKALPRGPMLKGDAEYEVVWRENANLGLVFSSVADVPKVTKVDVESGGVTISRVSVGDVLTWIGPLGIHDSSFHQSMATLRAVKRPVVLRFKRGHP